MAQTLDTRDVAMSRLCDAWKAAVLKQGGGNSANSLEQLPDESPAAGDSAMEEFVESSCHEQPCGSGADSGKQPLGETPAAADSAMEDPIEANCAEQSCGSATDSGKQLLGETPAAGNSAMEDPIAANCAEQSCCSGADSGKQLLGETPAAGVLDSMEHDCKEDAIGRTCTEQGRDIATGSCKPLTGELLAEVSAEMVVTGEILAEVSAETVVTGNIVAEVSAEVVGTGAQVEGDEKATVLEGKVKPVRPVRPRIMKLKSKKEKQHQVMANPLEGKGQPVKPKTGFFLYLDATRAEIVKEVGTGKGAVVAKLAGEKWRALSVEAREPFDSQAAQLLSAYKGAMEGFLATGGVAKRTKNKKGKKQGKKHYVMANPLEGKGQPGKPKTAFFCFLDSTRATIVEEVGTGKGAVVAKLAGERWRALPVEAKAPFESEAAQLLSAYKTSMEGFLAKGGMPKKRRRLAESALSEVDPTTGTDRTPEDMTPQKSKKERVQVQVKTHMVGISENAKDAKLRDGERLVLRRQRRSPDSNCIAIYDGEIGTQMGILPPDVTALLAPMLDGNRLLRMRGNVSHPESPCPAKVDWVCSPVDGAIGVMLQLSGPVELMSELDAFGASLEKVGAANAESVVMDLDAFGDSMEKVGAASAEIERVVMDIGDTL